MAFDEERLQRAKALERALWKPGMQAVTDDVVPLSVVEYIYLCMLSKDLEWYDKRYAQIQNEALERVLDEGFNAIHYFSSHPDYAISSLAVELSVDSEILSRYHGEDETVTSLVEEVPKLIANILYEREKIKFKHLSNKLAHSSGSTTEERLQLLQEYQEVRAKLQAYAQQSGGNVMV